MSPHDCHLLTALLHVCRRYLAEEVYTPEDMQSPFLQGSSYMDILKVLGLMKVWNGVGRVWGRWEQRLLRTFGNELLAGAADTRAAAHVWQFGSRLTLSLTLNNVAVTHAQRELPPDQERVPPPTCVQGQGVIVTSLVDSCRQLADAQSRRSGMAAQIVPQVHWVSAAGGRGIRGGDGKACPSALRWGVWEKR